MALYIALHCTALHYPPVPRARYGAGRTVASAAAPLTVYPPLALEPRQLKEERRAGGPGRPLLKVPFTQIRFIFLQIQLFYTTFSALLGETSS